MPIGEKLTSRNYTIDDLRLPIEDVGREQQYIHCRGTSTFALKKKEELQELATKLKSLQRVRAPSNHKRLSGYRTGNMDVNFVFGKSKRDLSINSLWAQLNNDATANRDSPPIA